MTLRFRHGCAIALLVLGACAQDRRAPGVPEGGEWVLQVRRANEDTDAALARQDTVAAQTALKSALALDVPAAILPIHARAVRQDLLFRLASVALQRDDGSAALDAADEGLTLGRGTDVFTANLLIARGRALEMSDRGKDAAKSYYEALQINQQLLRTVLSGDAGTR